MKQIRLETRQEKKKNMKSKKIKIKKNRKEKEKPVRNRVIGKTSKAC